MAKSILTAAMLLVGTSAVSAADLDMERMSHDSGFSWTGFYIGGSVGNGKAEDDDQAFPVAPGVTIVEHFEGESSTRGFHAGYMHQLDNFVIGAEYEYADLGIQYIGSVIGPVPVFLEETHMFKLRAGFAIDQFQLYGFGGATHATLNVGLKDWTALAGIGFDYALTDHVIVGGQYSHSWFDTFDGNPIEGNLDHYTARIGLKF